MILRYFIWRCDFSRTHKIIMSAVKTAPPKIPIVMLNEAKHLVIASECNERGNQRFLPAQYR